MAMTVDDVVQHIRVLIGTSVSPTANNEERIAANMKINQMITTDIQANPPFYLNIALSLIDKSINYITDGTDIMHDYMVEIYTHYGFLIIANLVKFKWNTNCFSDAQKEHLKQCCLEWCRSRLLPKCSSLSSIASSTLVLNSCSQVITEVFIRTWPDKWTDFMSACTEQCFLVTLSTFLNISDYLHNLYSTHHSISAQGDHQSVDDGIGQNLQLLSTMPFYEEYLRSKRTTLTVRIPLVGRVAYIANTRILVRMVLSQRTDDHSNYKHRCRCGTK